MSSRTPPRTVRASSAAAGSPRFSGSVASGTAQQPTTPRGSTASRASNANTTSTSSKAQPLLSVPGAGASGARLAVSPNRRARSKSPNNAGTATTGLSSNNASFSGTPGSPLAASASVSQNFVASNSTTVVNASSRPQRSRAGSQAGAGATTTGNSSGNNSRPQSPRSRASTTTGAGGGAPPAVVAALEERCRALSADLAAALAGKAEEEERARAKEADLSAKLKDAQEAYNKILGKQLLAQRQRAAEEKSLSESNRKLTHLNIAISKEDYAIQKSIEEGERSSGGGGGGTTPRGGGGAAHHHHASNASLNSAALVGLTASGSGFTSGVFAQQQQSAAGAGGAAIAVPPAAVVAVADASRRSIAGGGEPSSADFSTNHSAIMGAARESIEVRRLRRELTQKSTALAAANEKVAVLESLKLTQKAEIEKARREVLMATREKEELQHQTDRMRVDNNLKVGAVELELVEAQSGLVSAERRLVSLEHQLTSVTNELKLAKSRLKIQTDSDERQGTVRDQLLAASIAKAQSEDTIDRQRRAAVEANEVIMNLAEEAALLRFEVDKYRAASVKAGIILQYTPVPHTDLSRLGGGVGGAVGGKHSATGASTPTLTAGGGGGGGTAALQMQHLQQLLAVGGAHSRASLLLSPAHLEGSIRGGHNGVSPSVRSRSSSVLNAQQQQNHTLSASPNGRLDASANSFGGNPLAATSGGGQKNSSFYGNSMLNSSILGMGGAPTATSPSATAAGAGSPGGNNNNNAAAPVPFVYDPLANYQVALADPNKDYACVETRAARRLFAIERDQLLTMLLEGFAAFERLFNTHRAMLGTTAHIVERAAEQMTNELIAAGEFAANNSNISAGNGGLSSPTRALPTGAGGYPIPMQLAPPFVGGGIAPPTKTFIDGTGPGSSPNRPRSVSPSSVARGTPPPSSMLSPQARSGAAAARSRGVSPNSTYSSAAFGIVRPHQQHQYPADGGVVSPRKTPLRSGSVGTSYSGRIGHAPPARGAGATTPTAQQQQQATVNAALAADGLVSDTDANSKSNNTASARAGMHPAVVKAPLRRFGTPGRATSAATAASPRSERAAAVGAPKTAAVGSGDAAFEKLHTDPNSRISTLNTTANGPLATGNSTPRAFGPAATQPYGSSPAPATIDGAQQPQQQQQALSTKGSFANTPLSHRSSTPTRYGGGANNTSYSGARPYRHVSATVVSDNNAPAGADASAASSHLLPYVGTWYGTMGKDSVRAWLSLVNVFSPALENALHSAGFTDMIAIAHITEADLMRLSVTCGVRRKLLAAVGELQRRMALIREESDAVLRRTYAVSNKLAAELELVGDLDIDSNAADDDDEEENYDGSDNADDDHADGKNVPYDAFANSDNGGAAVGLVFEIPSADAPATAAASKRQSKRSSLAAGANNRADSPAPSSSVAAPSLADEALRAAAKRSKKRREAMQRRVAERLRESYANEKAIIATTAASNGNGNVANPTTSSVETALFSPNTTSGKDPRAHMDSLFREIHDWFADVRVAITSQDESAERILLQTSLQK